MSVLKYFKNITRSPLIGRQALSVFFFFKFATRSLEKKGGLVTPPTGDRGGLSPPPRATAGPSPRARQGACRPPSGDRGTPLYKDPTPIPSSFEPENSTKNSEKREG